MSPGQVGPSQQSDWEQNREGEGRGSQQRDRGDMYWDSMNRIRDTDNISYWMCQSGDALILFLFYFFPRIHSSLKATFLLWGTCHCLVICKAITLVGLSNIDVRRRRPLGFWVIFLFSGFVKFREIGHVSVRDFKFPRWRFFLCHHSSTSIIFTCHWRASEFSKDYHFTAKC